MNAREVWRQVAAGAAFGVALLLPVALATGPQVPPAGVAGTVQTNNNGHKGDK